MFIFLLVCFLLVIVAIVTAITWDEKSTKTAQKWNPWFLTKEVEFYKKQYESSVYNSNAYANESKDLRRLLDEARNLNRTNLDRMNKVIDDMRARTRMDEQTIKRLGTYIEGREVLISNLIAAEAAAREEIEVKDDLLKMVQPKVTKKGKKS